MSRAPRAAAAALALALAPAVLAYVLPVSGILERLAKRRAALSLASLEVKGTLVAEGGVAQQLAVAAGLPAVAAGLPAVAAASAPATFQLKVPGRCRLELATLDVPEASRPFVAVRDGKLSGAGGLERIPAAVAFVRSACALLAPPPAAAGYAAALGRHGVALADATLGRFDGHIAYVVGGRQRDGRPVAFVEKDGFQPLRLVSSEGGAMYDVRLLGWGSPIGGDWFPRAVEVWTGDAVRLRFTTERATANPRLADALFP